MKSPLIFLCVALLISAAMARLNAQEVNMQPGVAYVMSTRGTVLKHHNGVAARLEKGMSLPARDIDIETRPGAFVLIVFSNGLSLYAMDEARFSVESFVQEPFKSSPDDWAYEPSRSVLRMHQRSGRLAYYRPQGDPASTLEIETQLGTISSLSDFFGIETSPDRSVDVWLFSEQGTAIFQRARYDRDFIQAGQHFQVEASGQGDNTLIDYDPINTADRQFFRLVQRRLENARERIFFQTKQSENGSWDVTPHVVIDADALKRERSSEYFIHR